MIRFAFVTLAVVVMTAALAIYFSVAAALRLPGRGAAARFFCCIICRMLGIRIRVVGDASTAQPALIVANHVSWLDIVVLAAVAPFVFVSKSEIARWPLIGLAARLRPTVFVDRAKRQQTDDVNAQIAQRLAEGDSIVLFAEGTSSDGNRVLQFRSALFGAADNLVATGHGPVALQPVSLAYTRLQGLPMGRRHRPVAAWYGDTDFVSHLRDLVAWGAIDVTVTFAQRVSYAGGGRKALVPMLESRVRVLTAETLRECLPARPA